MFFLTLLLWALLYNSVELVVVRVEEGLLRGELRYRSTGNGQYCSFKGIPYAEPPVGELRFKAPQPPSKWIGERNAMWHGPKCPQIELGTSEFITGNEDCLHLNVYTPTLMPKVPLPVMFFIHGGGFVIGSGNEDEYGPDFLMDHNVLLVTINYRLGALGFLCLDIPQAPGNAGLKDQVAALRWVKKNIKHFGGNPDKITIFGQSAGGASVSLHALSPMSKGLFNKAIAMSGVCFNPYSVPFEPKRQGLLLAHRVGLYTEDPHEALNFLKSASVKAIVTAKPNLLATDKLKQYIIKYLTFPPVVEKEFCNEHFMVENPEALLLKGKTNTRDIILGHTSEEGITMAVSQKKQIFETIPYFKEMIVPTTIVRQQDSQKVLQLADSIQKHYLGNKEISEKNMKDVIKLYSYLNFVADIHRYLEMWVKGGNKAYLYKFGCNSKRSIYGQKGLKYGVNGAGHLDDLMYLFDGKKYNLTVNKHYPSYKVIVQYCRLFTNYAKCGDPTPVISQSPIWRYYNRNQNFMDIDFNLTPRRANLSEIDFWRRIYYAARIKFS